MIFSELAADYRNLWASMKIKGGADSANASDAVATILINARRYQSVQKRTGVPWFWIGAIHYRESDNDFSGCLHNGDHVIGNGKLTYHIPKGRGPFATWEDSAIDALKMRGLHKVPRWTIARMLYEAEAYNGMSYRHKGINSPYLWAGSNHEQHGMFIRDGIFDARASDSRIGVAVIFKLLADWREDVANAINTGNIQ